MIQANKTTHCNQLPFQKIKLMSEKGPLTIFLIPLYYESIITNL